VATDVVAGFFSFTEITDQSAHREYNQWHSLDHLPEQMPIPGIVHGQRWVFSPRCKALSNSAPSEFSNAHYLTLYLMRSPLDVTIDDFFNLASRLHAEDRFFAHRRALASGPLAVVETRSAPRVRVSAAALPFRPNRGVYAIVRTDPARSADDVESLLTVAGVAGVSRFRSFPLGSGQHPDDSVLRPAGARRPGTPFAAEVTICYLDQDPLVVAGSIGELLAAGSERDGNEPAFAGPFETIVPWSWDWFDQKDRDT